MDQVSSDPFNALVLSFTNRIRELRGLMLLRTPDSFDAWQDSILDLNTQLFDIERQLASLKERVAEEKKLIPRINEFKAAALAQQADLQYVQSHLPTRLPGKAIVPNFEQEKVLTHPPLVAAVIEPNVVNVPKVEAAAKKSAVSTQTPTIQYVTVDELENTPKYMKGRLTLDKVNAAVDELQKLVETKYKILALPITKMNDKLLKKYKGARGVRVAQLKAKVYRNRKMKLNTSRSRKMETAETKGLFFIAEPDLADTTQLKQGDATGRAVLTVLRHLHRLKDLGGTIKRLVIVT